MELHARFVCVSYSYYTPLYLPYSNLSYPKRYMELHARFVCVLVVECVVRPDLPAQSIMQILQVSSQPIIA